MRIWLAMVTADGGERPFPLSKRRVVIGCDTHCDLRVAMPSVAKNHCEVLVERDTVRLNDLGSPSGTLHNGDRVQHAILSPGDRLTIGPVTFIVRAARRGTKRDRSFSELKPHRGKPALPDTTGRTSSADSTGSAHYDPP